MTCPVEELRWRKFPALDDGFVCLVDAMGDDSAIADAARRSYGKGTRLVSEDRTLIRYMMRHHHGTPFEMAEIKLLLRIPNGDTWRQMIRNRAAPIWDESDMWSEPSVNAYSYRYSEADTVFQTTAPDAWRLQSGTNKQGSAGNLTEWPFEGDYHDWPEGGTGLCHWFGGGEGPLPVGQFLSQEEKRLHDTARRVYEHRLKCGVAREQARKDLPNSIYTEAYWKCDLRNVLHFLALRLDFHAQLEIRSYAQVIAEEIVKPLFPITWEAFEDYVLEAVTLSRIEVEVIKRRSAGHWQTESAISSLIANNREREECRVKFVKLGLVDGAEVAADDERKPG
jgi:thymidylate synthase (FAD)